MQAHLDALHLGVHHAQRPEHSQKRKQLKSYAVIFARSARPAHQVDQRWCAPRGSRQVMSPCDGTLAS